MTDANSKAPAGEVDHSRSAFDELLDLIKTSGVRVTFDSGRNINHPCTFCAAPGPHKLVTIGAYPNGDDLTRPVCPRCMTIAEARKPKEPRP